MSLHVIQCPNCESSFNINAPTLLLADGKVRCGACLTVFHAIDNVLEQLPADEHQDSDSVFVGNNPLDYFDPSSFLTRSALQAKHKEQQEESLTEDQELPTSDHGGFINQPILEESIELSEEYTQEFFSSIEQNIEESLKQTETERDLLLEELQRSETSFFGNLQKPRLADSEALDAELFPDSSYELVDPFEKDEPDTKQQVEQQDDKNNLFEVRSPSTNEFVNSEPTKTGNKPGCLADTETQESIKDIIKKKESPKDNTEVIRARALGVQLEDESALQSISAESIAALDITSTPVELHAGKQSRIARLICFSTIILLLGISLCAQLLWRNHIAYSQDARIRPLLEWTCANAACNLPSYSDINAIRSDNLSVRNHQIFENRLSVNIEFRNTAEFPQKFPIMVLSFNSVSNDIIALREFSPSEYLDSELTDLALMPVMSPVQVNLDLINPGPGIANYTLAFRLP